ncbi:MAG: helix-turn-helix domain-containing protein [Candidatus Omnitrophota bacterium]
MTNNIKFMSITEVADRIGVTPKTIVRWEKAGKVKRSKRDWRGWRVYDKEDFLRLKEFKETIIYFEEDGDGNDKE